MNDKADKSLLLRIKSLFVRSGVDEANAATTELARTSVDAIKKITAEQQKWAESIIATTAANKSQTKSIVESLEALLKRFDNASASINLLRNLAGRFMWVVALGNQVLDIIHKIKIAISSNGKSPADTARENALNAQRIAVEKLQNAYVALNQLEQKQDSAEDRLQKERAITAEYQNRLSIVKDMATAADRAAMVEAIRNGNKAEIAQKQLDIAYKMGEITELEYRLKSHTIEKERSQQERDKEKKEAERNVTNAANETNVLQGGYEKANRDKKSAEDAIAGIRTIEIWDELISKQKELSEQIIENGKSLTEMYQKEQDARNELKTNASLGPWNGGKNLKTSEDVEAALAWSKDNIKDYSLRNQAIYRLKELLKALQEREKTEKTQAETMEKEAQMRARKNAALDYLDRQGKDTSTPENARAGMQEAIISYEVIKKTAEDQRAQLKEKEEELAQAQKELDDVRARHAAEAAADPAKDAAFGAEMAVEAEKQAKAKAEKDDEARWGALVEKSQTAAEMAAETARAEKARAEAMLRGLLNSEMGGNARTDTLEKLLKGNLPYEQLKNVIEILEGKNPKMSRQETREHADDYRMLATASRSQRSEMRRVAKAYLRSMDAAFIAETEANRHGGVQQRAAARTAAKKQKDRARENREWQRDSEALQRAGIDVQAEVSQLGSERSEFLSATQGFSGYISASSGFIAAATTKMQEIATLCGQLEAKTTQMKAEIQKIKVKQTNLKKGM